MPKKKVPMVRKADSPKGQEKVRKLNFCSGKAGHLSIVSEKSGNFVRGNPTNISHSVDIFWGVYIDGYFTVKIPKMKYDLYVEVYVFLEPWLLFYIRLILIFIPGTRIVGSCHQ